MLDRYVLRWLTISALIDRTMAGALVLDSSISPLDKRLVADAPVPVIAVYTDDQVETYSGKTADENYTDLVIELVVAATGEINAAGDLGIVIPPSDDGLELTLDILEHQIMRLLWRDAAPASELFRTFVVAKVSRTSKRGDQNEGTRFAARQITYRVKTLMPPIVAPIGGAWATVLDAMEAAAGMPPIVAMLRGELASEGGDWPATGIPLGGLTRETAAAMGIMIGETYEDGDPAINIALDTGA